MEASALAPEILAEQGFAQPERWVEYARRNSFRRVPAARLARCPDCAARPARRVGQYVYYSNLVALLECECGLIYADTRIAPEVIQAHFETAYKDEGYFLRRRRPIFEQIAERVARAAPYGGRVLDIGGATGHLMAVVKQRRPDLEITVNDLSEAACRAAAEVHGFHTICGGVAALAAAAAAFDVVVMSDVIYYEPEIRRLWDLLPRLVGAGGAVIIRVPNKLPLLRLGQRLSRILAPGRAEIADRVRFFNPEHLFVFSPAFLDERLRGIGFGSVEVVPSRVLRGEGVTRLLGGLADGLIRAAHLASGGRVRVSPSLLLIARRGAVNPDLVIDFSDPQAAGRTGR